METGQILTHSLAFILGLAIKLLLDFNLAQFLIKYFHWIPVRSIFRRKDINLAGKWEESWDVSNASNFPKTIDRHSFPEIKQIGPYIYAETIANGKTYSVFGKLKGDFFIGNWYDKEDERGRHGVLQLRIINKDEMRGLWLGHSSKNPIQINSNKWHWKRVK